MKIEERIIRLSEVEKRIGLKKSCIYQMMADGTFPRQIKLGPRSVGWKNSDIARWIENLEESSTH